MVRAALGPDHTVMSTAAVTAVTPAASETGVMGLPRSVGGAARRLAADTLYLTLGLPVGILTFTCVVTGWSLSVGLAITLIGLPLGVLTVVVSRALATVERQRAALVLGAAVPERYRRPDRPGIVAKLRALLGDAQTWKDLAWHLLLLPLGIAGFTIAVTTWGTTLGLLAMPAWYWSIPDPGVDLGLFTVDTLGEALAATCVGLLSVPLTVALVRGSAAATGAFARLLLGPGDSALRERVEELTVTRAGAVDAAAEELGRIERDLHDGAQARIVAVAMDLGLAEQQAAHDPEAAAELRRRAQENAKQALVELRELARGMRPGLLAERGLGEAVRALVARSPVPATAEIDVQGRLPAQVETAAYYVVAEALTNAAKHAQARATVVRVAQRGDVLAVEVSDDGRGGADPAGGGLTGLRRRVEALDGRLRVASPAGGPTIVAAELPCAR
jgi:signal transduction histidine kinase